MSGKMFSSSNLGSTQTPIFDAKPRSFESFSKYALILTVWALYMGIGICIHTMNQCDTKPYIRKRGGERGRFLLRGGNRKSNLQLLQNFGQGLQKTSNSLNPNPYVIYIELSRDYRTGNPNETQPLSMPNFPCIKLPF